MTFTPLFPVTGYAIAVALVFLALGYAAYRDLAANQFVHATWLTWGRRTAAFVLVAFMGFGPSITEESSEVARANVDVYFVVDRTGSMAAEDYGPDHEPRLVGVRHDMLQIVNELGGGRFSIISFDSAASRQMPLTTDTAALHTWVDSLNQEITMYSSGSSLNRAYTELAASLQRGAESNPQNQRIVYILTDGENTTEGTRQSFVDLAQYIDGGAVLGYGTEAGGKMKRYDPLLESNEYIEDFTQSPTTAAVSKIDEKQLKQLASELGINYVHRTEPTNTKDATKGINPKLVAADGKRIVKVNQLMLWPFAAVLAGLLVWEFAATTYRTTRKVG